MGIRISKQNVAKWPNSDHIKSILFYIINSFSFEINYANIPTQ